MGARAAYVGFGLCIASCSVFTSLNDLSGNGSDASGDARVDAITVDAPVADSGLPDTYVCNAIDGGVPCTPGKADCFGFGECAPPQVCCSAFGCIDTNQTSTCFQKDGGSFACDETADCEAGQCCYGKSATGGRLGSYCMLECDIDPDDVIACKTNAECSKILDTCQITSCYGRTIQTCGGLCPK